MSRLTKSLDEQTINFLKKSYLEVKKLKDIEDDFSEPFKSKYAAIKILKNMGETLEHFNNLKQTDNKVASMLSYVHLYMGLFYFETEEFEQSEENLSKCVEIIDNNNIKLESIIILLSALNQLGLLWSTRNRLEKAKVFLDRAESIFKEYDDKKHLIEMPLSIDELFEVENTEDTKVTDNELADKTINKIYNLTTYYIGQIYQKMGKDVNAAIYFHATLKRQLETTDFDFVDWSLNAATLSQVFMKQNQFTAAKHHLGAATCILQRYRRTLEENRNEDNEEVMAAKWENFAYRNADVARCWAKYGILLMSSSKERLIKQTEDEDSNDSNEWMEDDLKDLKFSSIEDEIEEITKNVTSSYLLDFNDAAAIFKETKKWLDIAKSYYTLENHASDYIQVVQDLSQAYKYLSFFEDDETRQVKMHKRRINILEEVIKELNPQYYRSACQQIWTELSDTYKEIRDIKLEYIKNLDTRTSQNKLAKINHLTDKVIENMKLWLNSVTKEYTNSAGELRFPDEKIRPILTGYFELSLQYMLYINNTKEKELENMKKSCEAAFFLVDYCEKHPIARDIMIEELKVCKEGIKLKSLKMELMMKKAS